MTGSRQTRFKIATVGIVLFLVAGLFFVGEAIQRNRGFQRYARRYPGCDAPSRPAVPWARRHAELGWVSAGRPGELNPQGFRDLQDFDDPPPANGRRRLLVLGDSFVWGSGVEADETIPSVLRRSLGSDWQVFNVAAPGWGVDQMYLAYELYREPLAPDAVVLCYIDDDIRRVLEAYRVDEGLRKPVLQLSAGQPRLRTKTSRADLVVDWIARKSVLLSSPRHSFLVYREAVPLVLGIFETMGRELAERGGSLLIVRIPTPHDLAGRIGDLEDGVSVRYHDTEKLLREAADWTARYYQSDGHLSPAGTQKVAAEIAELVRGSRVQSTAAERPAHGESPGPG